MKKSAGFIVVIWSLLLGEWACTPMRYYGPPDAMANADSAGGSTSQGAGDSTSQGIGDRVEQSDSFRLRDKERGIASFMADETHGRTTANGEMYDMRKMVAAHLKLPFNSIVLVRNLKNGREVEVRINDRGPYVRGRIIDLSFEAAKQLGIVEEGSGEVEIEVVKIGK